MDRVASNRGRTCSAQTADHRASARWSASVSDPPRRTVTRRGSRTLGRIICLAAPCRVDAQASRRGWCAVRSPWLGTCSGPKRAPAWPVESRLGGSRLRRVDLPGGRVLRLVRRELMRARCDRPVRRRREGAGTRTQQRHRRPWQREMPLSTELPSPRDAQPLLPCVEASNAEHPRRIPWPLRSPVWVVRRPGRPPRREGELPPPTPVRRQSHPAVRMPSTKSRP